MEMILDICHDGELEISEIEDLHIFLRRDKSDIPAVPFLRSITRDIVADGIVDDAEAYRLKKAFERVVPKDIRGVVSTHLEGIGLPSSFSAAKRPSWHDDPATERQIEYICNLGGQVRSGMTKGEASELIDQLLTARPPSARQIMVLRFFDRMDLSSKSKDEVCEWIDYHYGSCEEYERAWERFKRETGHDPRSLDAENVPIGAYRQYMRGGAERCRSRPHRRSRPGMRAVVTSVVVVLTILLLIVIFA